MKAVFVRSPYNYDMDAVSDETGLDCSADGAGKTQQQFREETEMRNIVERFGLTGEMPVNPRPPEYGDFTGIGDYQSALNAVKAADEAFMEFPAHIRARFDHDPQRLLEFVADDRNIPEARKLGLLPEVAVVDASPEASKAP